MTIKGVFFDAADVLYRRPKSTRTYVSSLLKEQGLSTQLSPEAGMRHETLRSLANCGHLSPEDYWDQLLQMHGMTATEERKAVIDKINAYSDQIVPIAGGRELLAELKQRGFLLGVITDTIYPIERKMQWLDRVGVSEFIDVMACSTMIGAHKPHPAIYLSALQQAGLAPNESAFVGHDADELEGARSVGIATVAVNYDPSARADYYALSLVDLLDVPLFQASRAL